MTPRARGFSPITTLILAVATSGVLVWAAVETLPSTRVKERHVEPAPLSTGELRMMLVRAGMDAETLAASGVTAGSVTTALDRIREHLMGSITQVRAADAAFMSAQQDLRHLDQRIRSGRASDEEKSQRAAKASALASAAATRDELINGLWTAAGDAVTEAQRLRAMTIRNNRHREVPLIYRAGSFTDAQWIALRDALSESRRTAATGEELPGALADVLSAALGDQGVAFAKAHLESHAAGVSTAWETAAVVPGR